MLIILLGKGTRRSSRAHFVGRQLPDAEQKTEFRARDMSMSSLKTAHSTTYVATCSYVASNDNVENGATATAGHCCLLALASGTT